VLFTVTLFTLKNEHLENLTVRTTTMKRVWTSEGRKKWTPLTCGWKKKYVKVFAKNCDGSEGRHQNVLCFMFESLRDSNSCVNQFTDRKLSSHRLMMVSLIDHENRRIRIVSFVWISLM
jgi:hypothetical protein